MLIKEMTDKWQTEGVKKLKNTSITPVPCQLVYSISCDETESRIVSRAAIGIEKNVKNDKAPPRYKSPKKHWRWFLQVQNIFIKIWNFWMRLFYLQNL